MTVSKGGNVEPGEGVELDLGRPPAKGNSTRSKYNCPGCSLNAWAKPDINLHCGDCNMKMVEV